MDQLEQIYALYLKHNQNICIDSREKNIKNSIFFGIEGPNFDGGLFAEEAIQNGASIAIVNQNNNLKNNQIILVKDTIETLQKLARKHREKISIPVIGITGTNGKTTTKELLSHIISSECITCSTKGNFNNHLGVPLTILSITTKHQIAVVELGANHVGEIEFLCSIANPTHGIITNIGEAHLKGFGSIENILKTKLELYSYLQNNNGVIFVDKKNKQLVDKLKKYDRKYFYLSTQENKGQKSDFLYFKFEKFIKIFINNSEVQTKIVGDYNANNIAAAVKISRYFGIKNSNIISRIESFELKNNRSELIKTKQNEIILDAYNANPTSITSAIKNFINIKNFKNYSQCIIILGDMLELGGESLIYHQNIVNLLEKNNIELCFLIGTIFGETECKRNYIQTDSVEQCKEIINEQDIKNSIILIKGSRKMELERLVEVL